MDGFMNKKGFVFIETIVVTAILLASLVLVYSLFVSSNNNETRRLRYDDMNKLYQTYYLKQYLESFDLDTLKARINDTTLYQNIYPGQSDLFGAAYNGEKKFFESLWSDLHIQTVLLTTYDVSKITECDSDSTAALCANTNLMTYLRTLDNDEFDGYRLIVEFASKQSGEACTTTANCFYYYANVKVGA